MATNQIDDATRQKLLAENQELRCRVASLETAREEDRKTAEQVLERNFILSSTICPIAIADMAGNLTYVNDAFVKV